jgi:hypothetical protein
MKKITLILVLLMAIAGVTISSNAANLESSLANSDISAKNSGLVGAVDANFTYGNFLYSSLAEYVEDYNFSERILKDYVNKSISDRDAMASSTAALILTSYTASKVEANNPPEIYASAHNNTLLALLNLRLFLWNISKLFETNNQRYLNGTRISHNKSLEHYKIAYEELNQIRTLYLNESSTT